MTLPRLALLVAAFAVPPVLAGAITVAVRAHGQGQALEAAPFGDLALPAARPPVAHQRLAVILVGDHGTEITDSLPIAELLAASGALQVRVVAPHRRPVPLATNTSRSAGLDLLPDLGFDDYAASAAGAPDLLVVPYLHRWKSEDSGVVPWLQTHAGPETTVLSICRGAEIVAASGLFDGHAATANDGSLDALAAARPAVRWQRGVRWVRDGRRISSSLLAGGMDATLAAIDALAGRAAAERAAATTGYPVLRAPGDRSQWAAKIPVGTIIEAAYRWERTQVSVVITDGVPESAVAGLIDAFAATLTADTVVVADARRVVRSRHGLALIPHATTGEAGPVTVVAGASGEGAYGYDLALHELARVRGWPAARNAGVLLNYETGHLDPGVMP